jgi:hypothetical protein
LRFDERAVSFLCLVIAFPHLLVERSVSMVLATKSCGELILVAALQIVSS